MVNEGAKSQLHYHPPERVTLWGLEQTPLPAFVGSAQAWRRFGAVQWRPLAPTNFL